MTYGIIFVGYNTRDYLSASLAPWIEARKNGVDGNNVLIGVVNVPFKGFNPGPEDGTRNILQEHLKNGDIDFLIIDPENIPETQARGIALNKLKDLGAELVWFVDSDEFYSVSQISKIVSFVSNNPWIIWFKLCLKNYVFDENTYLVEPFTPPRIYRLRSQGYEAHAFSEDNDIVYYSKATTFDKDGYFRSHGSFPHMTIPQNIAWIRHLTWQNNLRSLAKIDYQLRGRGWPSCSFSWDPERGLIFNPNLPAPKTAKDTT